MGKWLQHEERAVALPSHTSHTEKAGKSCHWKEISVMEQVDGSHNAPSDPIPSVLIVVVKPLRSKGYAQILDDYTMPYEIN